MSVFSDYDDSWTSSGLFGSANLSLFDIVNFTASYASMTADTVEYNSFNSVLHINTDNIPKLSAANAFTEETMIKTLLILLIHLKIQLWVIE